MIVQTPQHFNKDYGKDVLTQEKRCVFFKNIFEKSKYKLNNKKMINYLQRFVAINSQKQV